jgi:MFS family permease
MTVRRSIGRQWLILCSIALSRVAFGFQIQTVGSLGPDLVARFGIDYTALGTLIGAYMLPGIVVALPLGLLGRRFGERAVVGLGVLLMAAGAVVCVLGGGPGGIFAGRVISGIGAVAMVVLQGKMVADWFHGRQLMLGLGVSVGSFPVGVGLAQLVQPGLGAAYGWQMPFLAGGLLAGVAAAMFIAVYRHSPFADPVPRSFSLPSWRECVMVIVAGLIWTFYTAPYSSFVAYTPSLLTGRGDGPALIAVVITIATWGNVPAILLGGGFANRIGHMTMFMLGTIAMIAGLVAAGAVDWPLTSAFLIGVIGSVQPSVIMAAGTLSARPENRAVGMSLFYSTYYIGGTVVPALCGKAADLYGGVEGAMYSAAALAMLTIPAFLLHRRLRHWAGVPGLA